MASFFSRLGGWVILVLTPFVILLTAVRLMMTPILLQMEYRMPGFPADPYGFTMQDRLRWSQLSMDYLLNNAGIEFFEPYRLPDGSPLYNDRELSHMDDVKEVVGAGRNIWLALLVVFLSVSIGLYISNQKSVWLINLRRGGWLLIGVMAALLLSILISFDQLFTQFHNLFFASGTWTFYYSDTFIRLFPIRCWQDCFLYFVILSVLGGVLFIRAGRVK
jgi:integral membrane protein (TIGR01906 family)